MNKNRSEGLTLAELLVAMGILAILMTAVISFFTSTSKGAVQVNSQAELQQDILNVEQLLAGRIREAWYIYTPDRGQLNLGSGQLRQNPLSNNGTWSLTTVTGGVPGGHILAMVLPPEQAGANCTGSVGTGCFRFYAYYPVRRSVWVAGTAADAANNPGPKNNDANTWVLAEMRVNYPPGAPAILPPQPLPGAPRPLGAGTLNSVPGAANYSYSPAINLPPLVPPGTGQVNLLADNLLPMTASQPMFSFVQEPASNNVHPAVNLQSVVIRIAAVQQVRGRSVQLPGKNRFYELRAFPGNLGRR
ncbi:PilW family protein [Deinococcus sp. Marseille-Q6407]|uniref:PilW family protein n=1 Tax=Deinococcus sp. Marseille-Q6407 TaxID=2969223 RepID=UPI0021BF4BC3|nr:type II secretion system protein [Deinococcus sp. Marseille-Q6407]